MSNGNENVGSILEDGSAAAFKWVARIIGVFVYLAMIAYSGVHNYHLMTQGVEPDMLIWAVMGVISAEASAIALPLALHYWVFDRKQRLVTFVFYLVDLGLIFINVVLSFADTSGGAIPAWGTSYLFYIVPATPIIMGVGWSIVLLMDPEHRMRAFQEEMKASIAETTIRHAAESAKRLTVNNAVQMNAESLVDQIVFRATSQLPTERQSHNGRVNGFAKTPVLTFPDDDSDADGANPT